jgi:hypothetical protein
MRVFVSDLDSYMGKALVRRFAEEEDVEVVGTVDTSSTGASLKAPRRVAEVVPVRTPSLVKGLGSGHPP